MTGASGYSRTSVPFLFAGLSSFTFGVADFTGGLAARRAPAVSVVVMSQVVGGAGVLLAAPFFGEGAPASREIAWGAAAGVAGAFGLVMFYNALASTRISVTAPVAAIVGTATPVLFGLIVGERPSSSAWVGVAVALLAIVFITRPPARTAAGSGTGRAVLLGSAVGVLFGLFGILISRTAAESGLWPLAGARGASLTVVTILALVRRRPLIPSHGRRLTAAAGALDMTANVFFLLAVREELLSLVAVIQSLYPASTIALARIVIGERIGGLQLLGLLFAALGVGLIVTG